MKIYGNSPIKLEKIIKKKTLIKIKIVPCIVNLPKTALNSLSKYKITFKKVFLHWEFINQNIWGKIKIPIKTETQFNINLIEKIFTDGSKEENRFIIFWW